ncbi:MAG TPA: hypothetical protein PLA03_12605, partial [Acidobacteriota bacterium]|nr:hypothetical protein [Acidobacteriota bacterium]
RRQGLCGQDPQSPRREPGSEQVYIVEGFSFKVSKLVPGRGASFEPSVVTSGKTGSGTKGGGKAVMLNLLQHLIFAAITY